jgi:hypothetical protein
MVLYALVFTHVRNHPAEGIIVYFAIGTFVPTVPFWSSSPILSSQRSMYLYEGQTTLGGLGTIRLLTISRRSRWCQEDPGVRPEVFVTVSIRLK